MEEILPKSNISESNAAVNSSSSTQSEPKIIHTIPNENSSKFSIKKSIRLFILIFSLILGLVAGYFTAYKSSASLSSDTSVNQTPKIIDDGKTKGSTDTKTFRDNAEGTVQRNDSPNSYQEGSHILVRDTVAAHNVSLTSSVVDLDMYVGKKVRVWGETNKGVKSGWLMDVGRIELLE